MTGRALVVVGGSIATAVIVVGTAIFMAWAWTWPISADQRLLVLGDSATVGTLLLAALAAVVAILAFRAATGLPDLRVRLWNALSYPGELMPFSDPGELMLRVSRTDIRQGRPIDNFKPTTVNVEITNNSHWSARNPLVRVQLYGITGFGAADPDPQMAGWQVAGHAQSVGVTAVQSDRGANYSIHGDSSRVLPVLDFRESSLLSEMGAELVIEIWAEGYRSKPVAVPFRLVTGEEWKEIMRQRDEIIRQAAEELESLMEEANRSSKAREPHQH